MQEAEWRTVEELRAHRPDVVEPFLRQLPKARASTLERLVSVLIREGFAGFRPDVDSRSPALLADTVPVTATGRLALTAPPRFRYPDGYEQPLTHPVEAWILLAEHGLAGQHRDGDPLGNGAVTDVAEELANSVCQHALALVGAADPLRHDTDWTGNPELQHEDPTPLSFFEQSVVDGHPAHYGAKSRRGLSPSETPNYAPEWRCRFDVPLVAVALTHTTRASAEPTAPISTNRLADHLAAEHPDAVTTAHTELREHGLEPDDYELIPAHPWQVRFVLPEAFAEHARSRSVVPLTAAISARPLMSARTLAPVRTALSRFPSHIKTSVDWQMTMAVRGVSRYAVENGPAVTALMDQVLRREDSFGDRLRIQGERAAAGFLAQTEQDVALQSRLGAILRDNPETDLVAGEIALPVAALYSTSPSHSPYPPHSNSEKYLGSGQLLVREFLDELVARRHLPSLSTAAQLFVAEHSRILLPALLTLLTRYGIALEAHPQNTVLILRDGAPVRVLVRDLGGARILPERLRAQGLDIGLLPDSPIIADNETELRDKLSYSLLTNHLGELLSALSHASGTPQGILWTCMAETAHRAFSALARDSAIEDRAHDNGAHREGAHQDRIARDRKALLERPLPAKTFLRMRLNRAVTESTYVPGRNPLRTHDRESHEHAGQTSAEIRTASFLTGHQPHLFGAFHQQLPHARRQGLNTLIAALLREDLLTVEEHHDDGTLLVRATPSQVLLVRVRRSFAFDHFHVSSVRRAEDDEELAHPAELVGTLARSESEDYPWCDLAPEIEESAANLAMSYACATHRDGELAALAQDLDASGIEQLALRANQRALRAQRTDQPKLRAEHAYATQVPQLTGHVFDRHLVFDRLCTKGHNLHPWEHSRLGMTPASAFRYAPECTGEASLNLVAVRDDRLLNTADEQGRDVGELLCDHFPEFGARARAALANALPENSDPTAYRFVPVHAWQARHVIRSGYADEVVSGVIVVLPEPQLPVTPTVSFRTVVTDLGRHGRRLVVKTALDVLITTSRRSISPATTYNGPRLSHLLRRLVHDDPIPRARARVVRELAGICWQPPGSSGHPDDWHGRNLSALCREDPGEHAAADELVVTGCAFYAPSPVTGRAILADFVENHRAIRGITPAAAALSVLTQYADLVLPTVLTLLVTHGIGLEAHLQNTLVVWRSGWPVRVLLRDFAGIRLHRPRFRAAVPDHRIHPESIILVDELDTVRDKAYYSALQANVAEVVRTLVIEFNVDEHECWRIIRERAEAAFTDLAGRDEETAHRAAADREALYAPKLNQRAFVRPRLDPETASAYHPVRNPMHDVGHASTAADAE